MDEQQFLKKLENRAKEHESLINNLLFPKVFISVAFWLGNHPWRILIPLAFLITFILHFAFGSRYYEFILKIFGKL